MLECKAEQPVWTQTANGANKKLVLHVQLRCGSLSITTPVSHLVNEFVVRSELHGQVSLAAVNQILCHSWGYEQLQHSKDLLKACFENVNIVLCPWVPASWAWGHEPASYGGMIGLTWETTHIIKTMNCLTNAWPSFLLQRVASTLLTVGPSPT